MSPATTSDDDAVDVYGRRKVAISLAYCGFGYQGMQRNPGAKTIEGDLEQALYLAGAVPEHERCQPKQWDFTRSARTDKGVSAVFQVVSGRFCVDPPGFVDRVNSHLPDQIRIFSYKRVISNFHAKKFCDRRRYVYLLPVFALDPSCHRDRESVMASLGSGYQLVKCQGCSDRGRKVSGLVGKREFKNKVRNDVIANDRLEGGSECALQPGISSKSEATTGPGDNVVQSGISSNSEAAMVVSRNEKLSDKPAGNRDGESSNFLLSMEECNEEENETKGREFSYDKKVKETFNRILKRYEGSHNFHNFTTRTKPEDPAARRHIISFTANKTITIEGIEFVWCEVLGQSFMLHQIRKMIGLAVTVIRGCAPESMFDTVFEQDVRINVPTAPEAGLYLDECFFTSYNNQLGDSDEEVSKEAFTEEAEKFKLKYIYPHIARMEQKIGMVGLWLHSLNYRNYPGLRPEVIGQKTAGSEIEG